jgi:hypothetical protein
VRCEGVGTKIEINKNREGGYRGTDDAPAADQVLGVQISVDRDSLIRAIICNSSQLGRPLARTSTTASTSPHS